jgi:uncharacterized protein (TIGR02118 family)
MAASKSCVVVIYNTPKDPAAFERYYADVHVPLVRKHAKKIGFSRTVLTKFTSNLGGGSPTFYRKAELWFDSTDALKRATATPEFKALGDDIPKFATGGATVLIGEIAA